MMIDKNERALKWLKEFIPLIENVSLEVAVELGLSLHIEQSFLSTVLSETRTPTIILSVKGTLDKAVLAISKPVNVTFQVRYEPELSQINMKVYESIDDGFVFLPFLFDSPLGYYDETTLEILIKNLFTWAEKITRKSDVK